MSTRRRIGSEGSETRTRIVEAAEQVIREEGYAAASSRRVATRAGLKPSLVHYYFPTTDDIFFEVFRRGAAQSDAMIEQALSSADPVRALWRFFTEESRSALTIEFIALAIHRPALRTLIAQHSAAMRAREARLFEEILQDRVALLGAPEGLSLVLAAIGRAIVTERALGVSAGHAEATALVETWLDRVLPPSP